LGKTKTKRFSIHEKLTFLKYYRLPANPGNIVYSFETFPEILSHSNFRSDRHTVIFHYESFQSANNGDVMDIIRSYLMNENFNFVLMDYINPMLINEGVRQQF
jgi:hypothetical protein